MSNGRTWGAEEVARLKRLVAAGWNDGQIGDEIGRDRCAVQRKRAELKLQPGQSPILTAMMARLNAARKAKAARVRC